VSAENTYYDVTIKGLKICKLDNLLGLILSVDLFYIAIKSKGILNTKNKQKKIICISIFAIALFLNISQNIGLAPENTYFSVLGH
jgi:hypothetical protein